MAKRGAGGEDMQWVFLNARVSDNGLIKGKTAYSSTERGCQCHPRRARSLPRFIQNMLAESQGNGINAQDHSFSAFS